MKTLNKLFIAALATTAMTACNNDLNNNSLNGNRTVNFTMEIGETASSRISMEDGTYTATFSGDNAVGIFVKGQGSYNNLEYTTTDGTTWDGPQINLPEGETCTYYAYYPYSGEVNSADAIAISVATDQETGGYLANDYLYCNTTSGETTVTLEYKHALSLVDVTLAGDAIGDDAVVSIINVATDATLDVTAPSVATGSTLADVNMDVLTNIKNFRAIIPAQKIGASTPIFRIETKGKTYEAKYNGEIDFAQGKYLALTITIGEEGGTPEVEITTSASINDWTEGSIAGGDITIAATEINVPLPTDGTFTSITNTWDNQKITSGGVDTWYHRSAQEKDKRVEPSYDTKEQAIKFDAVSWTEGEAEAQTTKYAVGAWSNNNIAFHSTTPLEAGAYIISFKVKSSLATTTVENKLTGGGTIGITVTSSNDDKLFPIYQSSNAIYWERTVTTFGTIGNEGYVEKSFIINIEKCHTKGQSSGAPAIADLPNSVPADYSKGINIIFYNYTSNSVNQLYLKDIKVTKTDVELIHVKPQQ